MSETRLSKLTKAAEVYGQRSFDNYAQVRSIAEILRDGFCAWLDSGQQCVFLVPPQGEFAAQNYRSAAFSVAGKGFLPLEPISFGLAVKISGEDDFMRLVLTCRKEGERMFISFENAQTFTLDLPAEEKQLTALYETLYGHVLGWFTDRVEQYDNGAYGSTDIGFDIQRAIVKA
ncbi:MAG: hypothetical protein ACPGVT_02730 [Maricaulaceae bacterium]